MLYEIYWRVGSYPRARDTLAQKVSVWLDSGCYVEVFYKEGNIWGRSIPDAKGSKLQKKHLVWSYCQNHLQRPNRFVE